MFGLIALAFYGIMKAIAVSCADQYENGTGEYKCVKRKVRFWQIVLQKGVEGRRRA